MTDFATIVRATGRRLCKRVHADFTTEPYDSAKTMSLHAVELAGLDSLAGLLGELATRRDCCLVRGEIIDHARTIGVRRLCRADPETGEQPTLHEAPRHWLALDLDSVPLDQGIDRLDIEACARCVLPRLPEAFRGAACVVQATTSHGIKPGARLRLWFWCSRPLTNAECKRWLAQSPVDRTLFSPAQPHYTAAPIFVGWSDPLPRRLGRLSGAPFVIPPAPAAFAPPTPPRIAQERPLGGLRGLRAGSAASRFAGLLCAVRRAPEGQRHPTLFWAACRAGEMVAAGELSADAAAAVLAQAAMEGGGRDAQRAERTARDGITRGAAEAGR